jgi:hypothetical protein
MLERVDRADAEQMVDEAARTRAPDGAADAGVPDPVRDVGHREEVGGHAGRGDDAKLVLEAIAGAPGGPRPADTRPGGLLCGAVAAVQDRVLTAVAERLLLLGRGAEGLGQVMGADAEVANWIKDTPGGQFRRGDEQPGGGPGRAWSAITTGHLRGDALGDLGHLGGAGQVGAAIMRKKPRRAER